METQITAYRMTKVIASLITCFTQNKISKVGQSLVPSLGEEHRFKMSLQQFSLLSPPPPWSKSQSSHDWIITAASLLWPWLLPCVLSTDAQSYLVKTEVVSFPSSAQNPILIFPGPKWFPHSIISYFPPYSAGSLCSSHSGLLAGPATRHPALYSLKPLHCYSLCLGTLFSVVLANPSP